MISSVIKKIFSPVPEREAAHKAYLSLVTAARKPVFYESHGVSDTIDGRFDVIILHIFLLTRRLEKESPELLRAVWEVFFSDMDRSLRETGVSDTGLGKHIKKMVQAFYGRINSYEQTIADEAGFIESLKRNLYRDKPTSEQQLQAIAAYVGRNIEYLQKQEIAAINSGNIEFCD